MKTHSPATERAIHLASEHDHKIPPSLRSNQHRYFERAVNTFLISPLIRPNLKISFAIDLFCPTSRLILFHYFKNFVLFL